ncbi:unnamed protein product [Discosporangium mesarthrocarpum]
MWGGEAILEGAGTLLSTARDGASNLIRDARAGVETMGANVNWPKSQRVSGGEPQLGEAQEEARSWSVGSFLNSGEYEVTFGEGRLGFTLLKEEQGPSQGRGIVCRVQPGSTADQLGVLKGDILCGLNKRRYQTYDRVMEVLPTLPRPVLITFSRGAGDVAATGQRDGVSSPTPNVYKIQQAPQAGPLDWLSNLDPFKARSRHGERGLDLSKPFPVDSECPLDTVESPWMFLQQRHPGEARAKVLDGVFAWSYYGPSEGVEPGTRDMYTEHVMRCQWGPSDDDMMSWMVARSRYREFDALDKKLRDAYPHRRNSFPNLPPKELFKTSADVVERRSKGLEQYMINLIRRFPDVLETPNMDKFLNIQERISTFTKQTNHNKSKTEGQHSAQKDEAARRPTGVVLAGTDYMNLMSSGDAYQVSQSQHSQPVDVRVAEDLAAELSNYVSQLSPTAHLLSDADLNGIIKRCQECWPRLKATATTVSETADNALLIRVLECDGKMERAFEELKLKLRAMGIQTSSP